MIDEGVCWTGIICSIGDNHFPESQMRMKICDIEHYVDAVGPFARNSLVIWIRQWLQQR
jgi:hypothetical protein